MTTRNFLLDSRFPLDWQMSLSERAVFISVLEKIRPKLSIEIGTYKGGSLQVISEFSERVIAIDSNSNHVEELSRKFKNVEFRIGNSTEVLPAVLSELNGKGLTPDFILVDGGHEEEQVKRDLNTILEISPGNEVAIICHDSFNPGCRRGIIGADWKNSPYVQEVEIDYVPGDFFERDFDTAHRGEMWSGFALAILSPNQRSDELEILESRHTIFTATYAKSAHRTEDAWIRKISQNLKARWEPLVSYLFVRCRPARWIRARLA